jgi:formamidopyrimidine-DNA glycosylase
MLFSAIKETLQEGIDKNGSSIDWVYRGGEFQDQFRVYGRSGKPCLTCGKTIARIIVAQRSTHYCENCQLLKGN